MREWISLATDNIVALWIVCAIGFTWNMILTVLVVYAIHRKPNTAPRGNAPARTVQTGLGKEVDHADV